MYELISTEDVRGFDYVMVCDDDVLLAKGFISSQSSSSMKFPPITGCGRAVRSAVIASDEI
jgi:hypothetical protein